MLHAPCSMLHALHHRVPVFRGHRTPGSTGASCVSLLLSRAPSGRSIFFGYPYPVVPARRASLHHRLPSTVPPGHSFQHLASSIQYPASGPMTFPQILLNHRLDHEHENEGCTAATRLVASPQGAAASCRRRGPGTGASQPLAAVGAGNGLRGLREPAKAAGCRLSLAAASPRRVAFRRQMTMSPTDSGRPAD